MEIDLDGYKIRNYENKDISSISFHANNPSVSANLRNRFPYPYTKEDAQFWIDHVLSQNTQKDFAIACFSEAIGGIGLEFFDDVYFQSAAIGYWLSEKYWGKGIMTKAVTAFTKYAFDTYKIIRIFANVFESNPASCRVLEKAGYTLEGRLKKSVSKNGKILDQFLYAKVVA
jgi:RimJ/RimL family protein N-acetyltransferase